MFVHVVILCGFTCNWGDASPGQSCNKGNSCLGQGVKQRPSTPVNWVWEWIFERWRSCENVSDGVAWKASLDGSGGILSGAAAGQGGDQWGRRGSDCAETQVKAGRWHNGKASVPAWGWGAALSVLTTRRSTHGVAAGQVVVVGLGAPPLLLPCHCHCHPHGPLCHQVPWQVVWGRWWCSAEAAA